MEKDSEKYLKELENKKISVLLDLHKAEDSKLKESYNGIVEKVEAGLLILNCNNPDFFIKKVYIDIEIIKSIWEYK